MELIERHSKVHPARVGILPGAFNPPTVAHVALLEAARKHVDEVLFVLPKNFPHKQYLGASLDERVTMLREISCPEFSIGLSDGGLFREIACEARQIYGPETALYFVCGADAADRIVNWNYGKPDAIQEILSEFELLVARRAGVYEPPSHLKHRIHSIEVGEAYSEVSSTEVRERIGDRGGWEHLVPPEIHQHVKSIYGG